jgi:NADPH2:quinone reductase
MESNKIKAIQVNEFGTKPVINEIPKPKAGKNQIVVKVLYSPINPVDNYCIAGVYPSGFVAPATIGFEGSGIIEEVGEELRVPHKVGEKVSFISSGAWAQYIVTTSELCIPVHESNSMEIAASHYINPVTVYLMLDTVKQAGVKAVIHDVGMSALGKMFIRLMKKECIKTINLVRKAEYFDNLTELGSDFNLNTSDPKFEEDLKRIAEQEGATIAFDAIAGSMTGILIKNMPNNSIVYVYGSLEDHRLSGITADQLMFRGKEVKGFWLSSGFPKLQDKAGVFKYIQENLSTVFKSDYTVFEMDEYEKAFEHTKTKASHSKALLKFN